MAAAVAAAVTALEADIAGLQDQIDTNATDIASNASDIAALIDDSAANNGTATTNSIAGLKAALELLDSTAGDAIGAIETTIGTPNTAVAPAASSTSST